MADYRLRILGGEAAANEEEVWCEIENYPLYEVSNMGRVRSWNKPGLGSQTRYDEPHILKLNNLKSGHLALNLFNQDGPGRCRVHRLVLEAFVGPCPEGMQSCHNNGVPFDNRLDNLRWDTIQANNDDRTKHGRTVRGVRVYGAKLTASDVLVIRKRHTGGASAYALAREYPVNKTSILNIIHGRTWAHI